MRRIESGEEAQDFLTDTFYEALKLHAGDAMGAVRREYTKLRANALFSQTVGDVTWAQFLERMLADQTQASALNLDKPVADAVMRHVHERVKAAMGEVLETPDAS